MRVWRGIAGRRTPEEIVPLLTIEHRMECRAAPIEMLHEAHEAPWSWSVEDRHGRFVAAAAIIPEPTNRAHRQGRARAWFCGLPGEAMRSGLQLRPLISRFRHLAQAGVYDDIRAWLLRDPVDWHFARHFGFAFDCGPAHGLSPTGRDLYLYRWRR